MISTKGRYALRVLIDLAEHDSSKFIPLKEIAMRQEISLKYLERILPYLSEAGYVESTHGKGGGYKLHIAPEYIVVGDVLRLLEGTLAPVSCLNDNATPCEKASECRTIGMWKEFYDLVNNFFDSKTIADLANKESVENYII